MADIAPSLDQLRAEIDQIDDALVRLLSQRVEIGRRVAAAKGDATGPFLRPGREAAILRRLVDKGLGQVPPMVIERIWREILAANLARQVDPLTVVWDPSGTGSVLEQARDRGGISTRIELASTAEAALDAVVSGRATLAVLPALRESEWRWWPLLLADRTPKPRVIARLPFFGAGADSVGVAAQEPDSSGDDISYFAAPGELDGALDTATGPDGGVWSLLSVDGFVGQGGAHHGHIPVGAYPLGAHARPYSP